MAVGDALRALANVVDAIDENDVDVVRAVPEETDGDEMVADLRIRFSVKDGETSGIGSVEPPIETGEDAVDDPEPNDDGTDADDSGVSCTHDGCSERFDSEHGMRIHRSKAHDDPETHRDPEVLASVYEEYDSFAAMRNALDVDVCVQTVRRWMIEHGVHTPNGSNPDAEASESDDGADGGEPREGNDEPGGSDRDPTPASEIDGELPESVTTRDLREAVEEATTLYEVQKRLGLDREAARDLLAEFDLLELVHGRVADQRRREELKQDLDDRFSAAGEHAESSSD